MKPITNDDLFNQIWRVKDRWVIHRCHSIQKREHSILFPSCGWRCLLKVIYGPKTPLSLEVVVAEDRLNSPITMQRRYGLADDNPFGDLKKLNSIIQLKGDWKDQDDHCADFLEIAMQHMLCRIASDPESGRRWLASLRLPIAPTPVPG